MGAPSIIFAETGLGNDEERDEDEADDAVLVKRRGPKESKLDSNWSLKTSFSDVQS